MSRATPRGPVFCSNAGVHHHYPDSDGDSRGQQHGDGGHDHCLSPSHLAFVYSRDNEDEARQAKVLTTDEARRVAVNIARLPELLGKAERDS
jgi:hypothetical protein